MFVSVSRTPGMESQEISAPCSAQQLRKVAQRWPLRVIVILILFMFWPNRTCRVPTLWVFSTRNLFLGLLVCLYTALTEFY